MISNKSRLFLCLPAILLCGCAAPAFVTSYLMEDECHGLASINIVDQNGVSEIVSNPDRLKQYATVDFMTCQPYQKVLRVYRRNSLGNIVANIYTYYPNGQPKQYLDITNGRALGAYQEWYSNGQLKVMATVIGGTGDLYPGVENTWLFDGESSAWNEQGVLLAKIPYSLGKLEGLSLYYHDNGAVWKKVPMLGGLIEGVEEAYFRDGALFQVAHYHQGKRHGETTRYWENGTVALIETYQADLLMDGLYYSIDGQLVAEVHEGNGFRAQFSKDSLQELQQYTDGAQSGVVKFYDRKGNLIRSCHMKDGLKDGDEYEYYIKTGRPRLLIQWSKGKIHGLVKSWLADGTQESQREMAQNKKSGVLTTWYKDGGLMLLEEYDQDKLVRGEYYAQGSLTPISRVVEGRGVATFYEPDGSFLKKVTYRAGRPELE